MRKLTRSQSYAVEILLDLLSQARLRWTFLMLIGFAALLTALATPKPSPIPAAYDTLLVAADVIEKADLIDQIASGQLSEQLPRKQIETIETALNDLRQVATDLETTKFDVAFLKHITIGPEYDQLKSTLLRFNADEIATSKEYWSVAELDDLDTLLSEFSVATPSDRSELREQRIAESVILEYYSAFGDTNKRLQMLSNVLSSQPSFSAYATQVEDAAEAINTAFIELRASSDIVDKRTSEAVSTLAGELRNLGFKRLSTGLQVASAHRTASRFQAGSISALGFSIPGIALQLILPMIALFLSLDIALLVKKTLDWTRQYCRPADVKRHLRIYPWIPLYALNWDERRSKWAIVGAAIAIGIHLLPGILIMLLLNLQTASPLIDASTILCSVGILISQIWCLYLLFSIRRVGSVSSDLSNRLDDHAKTLIASNFVRIESAWAALVALSFTLSIYFVSFYFVPSSLLNDRTELNHLTNVRAELEAVYLQRFHDHRDTYQRWAELVDDAHHDLVFMSFGIPETHPAYQKAEAVTRHPLVQNYALIRSNVDDIVLESRAALAEFDVEDLNELIEIMYVEDVSPLIAPIRDVTQSLASVPLSVQEMQALPPVLQHPAKSQISTPLPITYRTYVEIGGFAYSLKPLPPEPQVRALSAFMVDRGVASISGFDSFSAAFADLDSAIGSVKLQIVGVEIDRTLVKVFVPWLLVPFLALLLLRLWFTRRALSDIGSPKSVELLLSSTSSTFLSSYRFGSSGVSQFISGGRLIVPLIVFVLITFAPSVTRINYAIYIAPFLTISVLCMGCFLQRNALILALKAK